LFVIPFTVILGWMIGRPLTMLFDPFESIVLFFSVLTVNYVVQDGKSNWLEGMILICLCVLTLPLAVASGLFLLELTRVVLEPRYVIVALVFWFYPGTQLDGLLTCPA
jgi:Ca2+:H+ antiporter